MGAVSLRHLFLFLIVFDFEDDKFLIIIHFEITVILVLTVFAIAFATTIAITFLDIILFKEKDQIDFLTFGDVFQIKLVHLDLDLKLFIFHYEEVFPVITPLATVMVRSEANVTVPE